MPQKSSILIISLLLIKMCNINTARAAMRYAVASGNWSSSLIWSSTSGGLPGASAPGSADDVIIENAKTIALDANGSCLSLTIIPTATGPIGTQLSIGAYTLTVGAGGVQLNGASLTLSATKILYTSSSGSLVINGNLTIGSGTGVANSAIIDLSNGGNLYVTGTLSKNPTDGKFVPGTSSTLIFNGATSLTIDVTNFEYADIIINNTSEAGVSFGAAVTTSNVKGNITLQSGLLNLNHNITLNDAKSFNVASGSTLNAGTNIISFGTSGTATINGTLKTSNLNGLSGEANATFSSTNSPDIALGTSSSIEYYSADSQNITGRSDYGNVTLSGAGTKTLGANASIIGNLTILSGTFNLGSFTANRTTSGGTITISNGSTLKIGGTNSFPANYDSSVLGTTSLVEYNGSNQSVSAKNYGHLTCSGSGTKTLLSGTIGIAGNLIIGGTASVDAVSNSNTVSFNSSNSTQSLTGTVTFYNLTINNTSSVDSLVLNSPVNIANALSLTSGKIFTTSTNIFTLNSGATTTTGNANSYINGPMKYAVASTGSSVINLPIGKGNTWRPAILTVDHTDASSVTYTAEVINSPARDLGYSLPVDLLNVSNVRFWRINREINSNILISARVQLFYGADDGITDSPNLRIAKTIGTDLVWYNVGGTGTANGVGSITSDPFTSFSDFTPANGEGGGNALPIELLSFEAKVNNNQVDISWSTASETNSDHFTVERSADGIKFETIARVKGAGNSHSVINYEILDLNPLERVSYYRLKQNDFDGKYVYSNIVSIEYIKNESALIKVFPNPLQVGSLLNVEVSGKIDNKEVLIVVIDIAGREYYSKVVVLEDDVNIIAIDNYEKLLPGVYFVTGSVNNKLYHRKLVVK